MQNLRKKLFSLVNGDPGHLMTTEAALHGNSGLLVAQTQTQSVTLLGGFRGAVVVSLLDENGVVIASTEMHTFGVDGRLIGNSDRTDVWEHHFTMEQISRAKNLGIIHTWNPDWLFGIRHTVEFVGQLFMDIIRIYFGTGTVGDLGQSHDTESWDMADIAWSSRAALVASAPQPIVDEAVYSEDNSPEIYVIFGGAKFRIPEDGTLDRLSGGWSIINKVSAGALASIPLVPRDGTLLKEENSAEVWRFMSGKRKPVAAGNTATVYTVPVNSLAGFPIENASSPVIPIQRRRPSSGDISNPRAVRP